MMENDKKEERIPVKTKLQGTPKIPLTAVYLRVEFDIHPSYYK